MLDESSQQTDSALNSNFNTKSVEEEKKDSHQDATSESKTEVPNLGSNVELDIKYEESV